jgi:hypothetical protein
VFTNAAPLVAANIPRPFDCGAILAFPQRCAATTVVEFRRSVDAFIIISLRDGACIQVFRTEAQAGFRRALFPTSAIAISRLGRGIRGGSGRWGRGFMAPVDRRIPTPACGALGRRGVLGRGVTWDTATLCGSPVIASRRAACVLGWGRRVGRSPMWQTAVPAGPTVSKSST